jgi:hypothetical protein
MNNDLHYIAVQMFKDLYLSVIEAKYGVCYYMKIANGKGVYLNIKDTERILADTPLKALSPELILQRYKAVKKAKKQFIKNYDADNNYYNNYVDYNNVNGNDYYENLYHHNNKQWR